jgi:hypothetical protein
MVQLKLTLIINNALLLQVQNVLIPPVKLILLFQVLKEEELLMVRVLLKHQLNVSMSLVLNKLSLIPKLWTQMDPVRPLHLLSVGIVRLAQPYPCRQQMLL